jgi:hypothetical protein
MNVTSDGFVNSALSSTSEIGQPWLHDDPGIYFLLLEVFLPTRMIGSSSG